MNDTKYNALVVLGSTASGKTALAARLAATLGGEILSVDSRQVYRGLDIGSGKDLSEYTVDGRAIPYHLIDIVDLGVEFNVFEYQRAFFAAFDDVLARGALPIAAGGTGLYLDAILSGFLMPETPVNPELRAELETLDDTALEARLLAAKGRLHNTTDTCDRDRMVRAIEIAEYAAAHSPEPAPEVRAMLLGTLWDRDVLRKRVALRLHTRLENGMIEEVEALHAQGWDWPRLEALGLEYRFIAEFLQGTINNRNDLFQKLYAAIIQFAKRQDTWFRRMERNGKTIHWVPNAEFGAAMQIIARLT